MANQYIKKVAINKRIFDIFKFGSIHSNNVLKKQILIQTPCDIGERFQSFSKHLELIKSFLVSLKERINDFLL